MNNRVVTVPTITPPFTRGEWLYQRVDRAGDTVDFSAQSQARRCGGGNVLPHGNQGSEIEPQTVRYPNKRPRVVQRGHTVRAQNGPPAANVRAVAVISEAMGVPPHL